MLTIKRRHTRIYPLLLTLLLLGGMVNEAWAATVTYHILTLPISTTGGAGKLHDWNFNSTRYTAVNYRYEALVCTSTSTTVGLPEVFKSPLLKDAAYKYYSASKITKTSQASVYANNNTKLDLYQIKDDNSDGVDDDPDLTAGSSSGVSDGDHIYVIYTYDPLSSTYCTPKGQSLKLDGTKRYSIQLSKDRFLAYNRDRGNRITAPLDSKVSNGDAVFDRTQYFTTTKVKMFEDKIVNITTAEDGVSFGDNKVTSANLYFLFKLQGGDPYHIIIQNGYTYAHDNWTYTQNNLKKKPDGGILYGNIKNNMWLQNEDYLRWTSASEATSTEVPGTFKDNNEGSKVQPVVSAFVLINHPNLSKPANWQSFDHDGGEYAFVASKMNYNGQTNQPTTTAQDNLPAGQYYFLQPNGGLNPQIKLPDSDAKKCDNAILVKIGAIEHFVYKVKTPFGHYASATLDMSTIFGDDDPMTCIPEALKRKYVTFKGAYSDDNLTSAVSTFATAATNCTTTEDINGVTRKVIYLKYETNMPFETCLKPSPTYDDLKWYNFYTNKEVQYIAWAEKKNDSGGTIDHYNFHTKSSHSRYGRDSHFAFVGDPFEMKIVSRKASDDAGSLKYVTINDTGNYIEGDGTSWEMIYDDNTGNYSDCFRLNKFNDTTVFGWHYGTGNYALYGGANQAARLTVIDVPTKSYVYHIMRNDAGDIAAKATVTQETGVKLDFAHIPEIIRSPFVGMTGATLSFYASASNASSGSSAITYAPDNGTDATQDIWVRYDISGVATEYKNYIDGKHAVNVRLNGEYIYYDSSSGTIKSQATITNDEASESRFLWVNGGTDPYAMTIKNNLAAEYVTASAEDNTALGWDASETNATKFIIKNSTYTGVYEVMYATGDGVDASTTYYNIGRDNTGTKIFSNATYAHGYDQLRFLLTAQDAQNVTYHLIDKAGTDLLQVVARQSSSDTPMFPTDYRSPLVATYHYWLSSNFDIADSKYTLKTSQSELSSVGANNDIYVTYDTSDAYDLQNKKIMYLLKYDMGDTFKQENGSDGLSSVAQKAIYPYCNGDCNFFVYGQEQFDIQQQGAASTRTRWAWFLESANNDPYHVKICSRQTETYNNDQARAYFHTYVETYGGTKHLVTTLAWPGVSGVLGTEYMVLGTTGQFRLVTTNTVAIDLNDDGDTADEGESNERRTVTSFEQYWKTWDTIRKKVLGDSGAKESQSDPSTVPATPLTPTVSAVGMDSNRTYLETSTTALPAGMGWHSYEQWAYGKRWNGYNVSGAKSKGWEPIEHWYQTVNMGEGYFDLVPITIDPALILLDQHGWEIMRKPLPSSEDDPDLEAKHAALRVYDSPMVKEYHFWTKTSKRTGFHQYYNLSQPVSEGGVNFSSTSLGDLPPVDATNVKDAKGNILDQYVTYVVKDEYVQSLGEPFLIQQGSHFASATDASTLKNDNDVPATGGMSKYIIDNITTLTDGTKNNELWTLKPNADIDIEMGYLDATKFPEGYAHDWTNDYTVTDFSASGFDPYNIQISSVAHTSSYFVTNATKAEIDEGAIVGDGTTNSLGTKAAVSTTFTGGMDNRTLQMTNATFMAVQDENGNMQLMPRFDHTKRMKDFTELVASTDPNIANSYTYLYRPLVYNYRIIDNDGKSSISYQSGGDLIPSIPSHLMSPLAKDFVFYKGYTYDSGSKIYDGTTRSEIAESLAGAGLAESTNNVFVRYNYDPDADDLGILKGKWLTMKLNNHDMQYTTVSTTAGIYYGEADSSTKPDPVDNDDKKWQWKFLASPQSDPDPYAMHIYNRQKGSEALINDKSPRFVVLSYPDGGYAFASAEENDYTFKFLQGKDATDKDARMSPENSFTSTSGTFTSNGIKNQILLFDDVQHTYTYYVYTNGTNGSNDVKYGSLAVSATQTQSAAEENDFVPVLPEEIRSPLLNIDQFLYYGAVADMGNSAKKLTNLYGLYEDDVYVRYTDYDPLETEYKVPNVKAVVDSKVARDGSSNDAALDISGELVYNIIWYNDNMMQSTDNSAISDGGSHALDGAAAYVWQFEGNDPYAIKIKHKNAEKYADGTATLNATATTFMLLPSSDGWQYGVLAKTGDSRHQLSGYGQTLADTEAATPETPTKFIIFGLSTHKVIYHLVIQNIGSSVSIPYRATKDGSETTTSISISGSTKRDLTTTTTVTGDTYQLGSTINGLNYCVDNGHVTLGAPLAVPAALERPNCKYFYYVEGVYTDEDCDRSQSSHVHELDVQYRGLQITKMGKEPELVGSTVRINVVYEFNDGLTETNNGSHFVTNATGTEWYSFETSDDTPYLAHYTYKNAKLSGVAGRVGHYTNDFLWSPVGDPYGFVMYNRYVYKNGGHTDYVMTTSSTPAVDADLVVQEDTDSDRPVYELLPGNTDGYFKVQTLTAAGGTPLYLDNNAGVMTLKASTSTEWTFGLSDPLLDPYYLGAGNVGGLNPTGKAAYDEAADLMAKQAIVYNDVNIVQFTPGYYRLFNEPNSSGITTPRYLSGYTHKIELTAGESSTAIPMHFYEMKGVNTTFEVLGSGFTTSSATHGVIPITGPEYDPASIFYITGSSSGATMQTQGLYVNGAAMTESPGSATSFIIDDLGGAVVTLRNASDRATASYLNYNQETYKYDAKFTPNIGIADETKWCMEPANTLGLYIETHSGGEEAVLTDLWYYSSYCVPFDLLIADKDGDDAAHSSNAYTCVESDSPWNTTMLHPKPIGNYNTGTYADNDYFVPAGTPVLFSTKRATSYIKATIPTPSPSTPITTIFSAEYLEQLLPGWDNEKRVYVFGPKMDGNITLNTSTGEISAVLPSLGNTNVGFYLNANPNKELGMTKASWTRHNYYVLHNKIYYRETGSGSREMSMRGIQFVPVIFGDEEGGELPGEEEEDSSEGVTFQGDGCIYDLMGRKVATRQQVEDGSWRLLRPGIYILNGKKFRH